MTVNTKMTLVLLQELRLARCANDAESFKGWLALGLEELKRQQQYLRWNDGVTG